MGTKQPGAMGKKEQSEESSDLALSQGHRQRNSSKWQVSEGLVALPLGGGGQTVMLYRYPFV